MKKPSSCEMCPLYGDGQGFTPDTLVEGCKLTILAQNPGENEEKGERVIDVRGTTEPCPPQPLVGKTGYDFTHKYLHLTGFKRDEVSLCNLLKCRWNHTNDLPSGKVYEEAVAHCTKHHLLIPQSTQLILAMGAPAWEWLGGPKPITEWRGYTSPTLYRDRYTVFGTLHLADLYGAMAMATMKDYYRVGKWFRGEWPRPIPHGIVASPSSLEAMIEWFDRALRAEFVAVDTEYNPETRELYLIGLGYPGGTTLQVEWRSCAASVLRVFVQRYRQLIQEVPIVFQNALADVPIIRDAMLWRTPPADYSIPFDERSRVTFISDGAKVQTVINCGGGTRVMPGELT